MLPLYQNLEYLWPLISKIMNNFYDVALLLNIKELISLMGLLALIVVPFILLDHYVFNRVNITKQEYELQPNKFIFESNIEQVKEEVEIESELGLTKTFNRSK